MTAGDCDPGHLRFARSAQDRALCRVVRADQTIQGLPDRESSVWLAKAQNVAIGILDIKIEARPRFLCQRLDHLSATHFELAEKSSDAGNGNECVQMFVLFPVFFF